jgi:hypothetical protein
VTEHSTGLVSKITASGARTVIYTFTGFPTPVGIAIVPPYSPVGGLVLPINKISVLTPYLVLAGLIIAVSTVFIIKKNTD